MAQRRAKKRWRPAKAQPAQVAPAANDDTPYAGTQLAALSRRLRARAAANDAARVGPTPEQLARGTIAPVKTKDPDQASSITLPRNAAAPVDRWRARKLLTERQFDACDRYRSDYARGGYERSVISRYDGGCGSGDGTPNMSGLLAATAAQLDARQRLAEARVMLPARMRGYFDAIVLQEAAADGVGGELGRTGNTRATLGLFVVELCGDILGDWYRLP